MIAATLTPARFGLLVLGLAVARLAAASEAVPAPTPAASSPAPVASAPAPASSFLQVDSRGEVVTLDALKVLGKITVVFFTSPHCSPCSMLSPSLKHLSNLDPGVQVRHVNVDRTDALGADFESAISKHYGITSLPDALIFDETGKEIARGESAIDLLVNQFGNLPPPEKGEGPTPRGEVANAGVSEITQGNQVAIEDYLVAGKQTVIDFFSPFCGPCVQISPLLHKLAHDRPDVVVRTVNINRPGAWGIDWGSPVARQYRIQGVPYMRLYGPDGKLKSQGQRAIQEVLGMAGVE